MKRYSNTYISLLMLALTALTSCQTFEYSADEITIDQNSVQLGNVGFKGFSLNPPDSYKLLQENTLRKEPAYRAIESLRIGYRQSNGLDYHFHQDFVFKKGDQLIYFVPFQNKGIRQFRHTPPDILERYLIDWVRDACQRRFKSRPKSAG